MTAERLISLKALSSRPRMLSIGKPIGRETAMTEGDETPRGALPATGGKPPFTGRLRQNNPSGKFLLAPSGKSLLQLRPSHPARGALAIVTNVGRDAVDAAASARKAIAGRVSRERSTGAQDERR
jgi:hypothetical protein